jgi:hypothetical protein
MPLLYLPQPTTARGPVSEYLPAFAREVLLQDQ